MPEVREERGLFQDDGIRETDFLTALTAESLKQALVECSQHVGIKICLLVPYMKDVNDILRSFWTEYAKSTLRQDRPVDFVVDKDRRIVEFKNNSGIYVHAVEQTPLPTSFFNKILYDNRISIQSLTNFATYCSRTNHYGDYEPEIDTGAVNEWLNRFPVKDAD